MVWEVVLGVEEVLLEGDGGVFWFWKNWLGLALSLVGL